MVLSKLETWIAGTYVCYKITDIFYFHFPYKEMSLFIAISISLFSSVGYTHTYAHWHIHIDKTTERIKDLN